MDTKDPVALLGAVTDRRLSALRLLLATGGVSILYLVSVPADAPDRLTYVAVLAYVAYSLAIYLASRRRGNFSGPVLQGLVWTDVAWYALLTSLSHGTNSLYFFFYLFAIVVASSRVGFRFAALVSAVSAGVYIMSGFVAVPPGTYDMVRLTTRPLAILGLGFILAYWGGAENALKKRLALLNELSVVANPRFGVDWTIELILRRLLGFWEASQCLILLTHDNGLFLYLVSAEDPNRSRKVPIANQSDVPFIDMSDPAALVYADRPRFWAGNNSLRSYDARTNIIGVRPSAPGEALAEFLSVHSFVSAPLRYRERYRGRIVVSSTRPHAFDIHDAVFLQQVANQALPVIENIRLVERMASDASDEERNRLARSVHDRVIQPYYGLQMGLKALHSALGENRRGNGPVQERDEAGALLAELMSMTADGIDELRQYVAGLKPSRNGDARLADSIRRFAAKFEQATGIHVKVSDRTEGFAGNELITSEVFQMAAEALSNVHRHTQARSARVTLNLGEGAIHLQVENDRNGEELPRFTPGSISDRAEALGGRAEVHLEEGRTILRVKVPL